MKAISLILAVAMLTGSVNYDAFAGEACKEVSESEMIQEEADGVDAKEQSLTSDEEEIQEEADGVCAKEQALSSEEEETEETSNDNLSDIESIAEESTVELYEEESPNITYKFKFSFNHQIGELFPAFNNDASPYDPITIEYVDNEDTEFADKMNNCEKIVKIGEDEIHVNVDSEDIEKFDIKKIRVILGPYNSNSFKLMSVDGCSSVQEYGSTSYYAQEENITFNFRRGMTVFVDKDKAEITKFLDNGEDVTSTIKCDKVQGYENAYFYYYDNKDLDIDSPNGPSKYELVLKEKPGYLIKRVQGARQSNEDSYGPGTYTCYSTERAEYCYHYIVSIDTIGAPSVNDFMGAGDFSLSADFDFLSGVDNNTGIITGETIKFTLKQPTAGNTRDIAAFKKYGVYNYEDNEYHDLESFALMLERKTENGETVYTLPSQWVRSVIAADDRSDKFGSFKLKKVNNTEKMVSISSRCGSYGVAGESYSNRWTYIHCSEWADGRWEKIDLGQKMNIPSSGTVTFAFDISNRDNPSEFAKDGTLIHLGLDYMNVDAEGNPVSDSAEKKTIRYPDEEWAVLPDGHLHSLFTTNIDNNKDLIEVTDAGFNFCAQGLTNTFDQTGDAAEVEVNLDGYTKWNGYYFETNTAKATGSIVVKTSNPSFVPDFRYTPVNDKGEVTGSETSIPVPSPKYEGDTRVYTYNFTISGTGPTSRNIVMKANSNPYIRAMGSMTHTINYDSDVCEPEVRLNSATGTVLSFEEDGKSVKAPYGEKLYIALNVKNNCKVSAVKVGTANASIKNNTITTEVLKADTEITVTGTELTALYVNDNIVANNKYTANVKKQASVSAYVQTGADPTKKYPLNASMITVKAGTEAVACGENSSDAWYIDESVIKFNLKDSAFVGKTVNVTIKDGAKNLGTMALTVSAYATKATVTSEKSNVISQDVVTTDVEKSYSVTFNTGVEKDDISIEVVPFDVDGDEDIDDADTDVLEDIVRYEGGTLYINSTMAKLHDITDMDGVIKDVSFKFVDTTNDDGAAKYIATKTIKFTNSVMDKITPKVTVTSSTDRTISMEFGVSANCPGVTFHVTADAVVDSKNPTVAAGMKSHVEIYTKKYGTTLMLANDGAQEGDGKAQKYNITVEALHTNFISNSDDESESPETIYSKVYGKSKAAVSKNQSTKDPYYETKLTLQTKKATFIAGEKDLLVAQAKFSAKTTYQTLKFILKDSTGAVIGTTNPKYPGIEQFTNSIVFEDTSNMPAGKYTLVVSSDQPAGANDVSASIAITVDEPIRTADTVINIPSKILYVSKSGGKVTPTVAYTNNPKVKKLNWSIAAKADNGISAANLKNVTINKTSGMVTVNKNYDMSDGNNTFVVKAQAADYSYNPAVFEFNVVVTNSTVEPKSLVLYKEGETPAAIANNQVYSGSSALDGKYIMAKDADGTAFEAGDVSYTSSNQKVVKVDAKTGKLEFVGYGKTNLVATATNGSNKKLSVSISVTMPAVDMGLWINENEDDSEILEYDNDGADDLTVDIKAIGADGKFASFTDDAKYTIKVKSGGTLISTATSDRYEIIVNADTTVIELVNNTKKSTEAGYKKTYTVDNKLTTLKKGMSVSVPTTLTPGTTAKVKVTGFAKTDDKTDYSVRLYFTDGIAETDAKLLPEDYDKLFEQVYLGDEALEDASGNLDANGEITLSAVGDSTGLFDVPVGTYTVIPYVADSNDDYVFLGTPKKIKVNPAPAASVSAATSAKILGRTGKSTSIKINSLKNVKEFTGVSIVNANANGEIVDAKSIFDVSIVDNSSVKITAKAPVEDFGGRTIKAYIKYTYKDMAGVAKETLILTSFTVENDKVNVSVDTENSSDAATAKYTAVSKNMYYKQDYIFTVAPTLGRTEGYNLDSVEYYKESEGYESGKHDALKNAKGQYYIPSADMTGDIKIVYKTSLIENIRVRITAKDKMSREIDWEDNAFFSSVITYNSKQIDGLNIDDDDSEGNLFTGGYMYENEDYYDFEFSYNQTWGFKINPYYKKATPVIVKVDGVKVSNPYAFTLSLKKSYYEIEIEAQPIMAVFRGNIAVDDNNEPYLDYYMAVKNCKTGSTTVNRIPAEYYNVYAEPDAEGKAILQLAVKSSDVENAFIGIGYDQDDLYDVELKAEDVSSTITVSDEEYSVFDIEIDFTQHLTAEVYASDVDHQ